MRAATLWHRFSEKQSAPLPWRALGRRRLRQLSSSSASPTAEPTNAYTYWLRATRNRRHDPVVQDCLFQAAALDLIARDWKARAQCSTIRALLNSVPASSDFRRALIARSQKVHTEHVAARALLAERAQRASIANVATLAELTGFPLGDDHWPPDTDWPTRAAEDHAMAERIRRAADQLFQEVACWDEVLEEPEQDRDD